MNHQIDVPLQLQGIIELKVLNAEGEVVRELEPFTNLITNAGLEYLLGVTSNLAVISSYCKVGTGTSTPANGDTVLPGFVGFAGSSYSAVIANDTVAPYYYERAVTYLFGLGAVVGTMGCIGISAFTGNSVHAWSRIKDSGNNPTTLTILAGEQLQVTYRLRCYCPPATASGSFLISGISYNYDIAVSFFPSSWVSFSTGQLLPNSCNAFTYTSGSLPANPTVGPTFGGYTDAFGAFNLSPYVSGSFERIGTVGFVTTQGNLSGGIKGLFYHSGGLGAQYHMTISPAIPKDNTKTLNISSRFTIGRYP